MKGFINTIRNIIKIDDLRNRILYALALILIYRVGSFVVLPGMDPESLDSAQGPQQGILGLVNMFAGGAFSRASIFALGIMPYISASIIIQLMSMTVPFFQRLQKEGESGRRKVNQITRYLTVLITATQASAYVKYLTFTFPDAIIINSALFWATTTIILTAGTIFVMWIGEKITDKGIGNGISLIIMIGIIAGLPFGLTAEIAARMSDTGSGPVPLLIELVIIVVIVATVILLVQGTRKIPVQYAKRVIGNKMYGGVRNYIPFKVNAAGVMPIIFAQAIMFVPQLLTQVFRDNDSVQQFMINNMGYGSVLYNAILATMVVLFTYFYTAILYNPVQMADEMKRNGAFIPGVKPGKKTAEYLDSVMSRITLPGSLFLAFVTIIPAFAMNLGVNQQFALFFGGTSLLILVGVVLDTLQQIESHLLMRHYDGLMKSGKIKGRTSAGSGANI